MPKTVVLSRRTFLRFTASSMPVSVCVQNRPQVATTLYPLPRFWFGQLVRYQWLCDDHIDLKNFGQTLWSVGEVKGLVYAHPGTNRFLPQWNYFIEWIESHPAIAEDIHFCPEPYAEEELEPA